MEWFASVRATSMADRAYSSARKKLAAVGAVICHSAATVHSRQISSERVRHVLRSLQFGNFGCVLQELLQPKPP